MAVPKKVFIVFLFAILEGVDQGLVAPSMAGYIDSLGGSRTDYGEAIASFYFLRLIFLPIFGYVADRGAYNMLFSISLITGIFGGIVYSAAPIIGPSLVIVSRSILGLASATSAADVAFIARSVDYSDRTAVIGTRQLTYTLSIAISPILNTVFVALPASGSDDFSPYTYCGYAIGLANLIVYILFVWFFRSPVNRLNIEEPLIVSVENTNDIENENSITAGYDAQLQSSPVILRQSNGPADGLVYHLSNLKNSGAWLFFLTSFQNNFNQQVVQWSLPLIANDNFGWGQKESGYLFACIGLIGGLSLGLIVFLTSRFSDRILFICFQLLVGTGILMFLLLGAYKSDNAWVGGRESFLLSVAIFFTGSFGQIPCNIGLYSKLVGSEGQGKYHASLQMSMAIARMISGHLVGASYDNQGSGYSGVLSLWVITFSLWMIPIPIIFWYWESLSPQHLLRIDSQSSH